MIVSLNEVESTIFKAARGAGMAWGLAEEAAQAARWLAERRLPFESLYVALFETQPWRVAIEFVGGVLRPRVAGACLCPIRAGAFLSDAGAGLPIGIENLSLPLLLAPFAARRDQSLNVQWGRTTLQFDGGRLTASFDPTSAFADARTEVAIVRAGDAGSAEATFVDPKDGGLAIDPVAWAKLQTFESRVYVPASLESRMSGAGSKLDDND